MEKRIKRLDRTPRQTNTEMREKQEKEVDMVMTKKYKIQIGEEEVILDITRLGNCALITIKNTDGEKLYHIGIWDHGVIKVEKYKTETEEIKPIEDEKPSYGRPVTTDASIIE